MNETIDILCMLCGVYLLYTGIVMKAQGRIIANVVFMKNMNENSLRDKEGFIRYLYGKLVIIGLVIILTALASIVGDYMGWPLTSIITSFLFIASMIVYAYFVSKALKMYCK